MDNNAMQDLWNRFETWLAANAPKLLKTLQTGATDAEIAQTEALISAQFPEDFKASYRIHNGQIAYESGLINTRELLSLERIQGEWKVWKELYDGGDFDDDKSAPTGPIRDDWWNPAWIPITYDGAGNHDCLDLAPAEGGNVGQIIDFWHDDSTREVKAESFSAWFAEFVAGCESGKYVYSAEYDSIAEAES